MQPFSPPSVTVRPVQYRDLEAIHLLQNSFEISSPDYAPDYVGQINQWFKVVRFISWLPNPLSNLFRAYVAEVGGQILGFIRVSPVNHSRTTWQIDQISVMTGIQRHNIGTQLIRHCLESCWEARTWILNVDVNCKDAIALYRQNGFQPLAQITDWEIPFASLHEIAQNQQPDLPNLLPVSNADAFLLYQLDTAAMPPQIRQVYDLSINDFRQSLVDKAIEHGQNVLKSTQHVTGYVYEPQRKAAIGYFSLVLQSAQSTHNCHLTVHPAYTWLYKELVAQMARIIDQEKTPSSVLVSSADYQPEREAYLEQIQATRKRHSMLMARSVWHKVRETKPALDALQLSRMLTGLQPVQKPIPGRIDTPPSANPDNQ
ncbi:acetyltransferase [Synechococcus sp. PCC 7502]|uniref:GNAT family N-acetyltransferase n=1 Tax=Synechococcus sp. PCC 7502 TaxID=1173263 RepID=UPI00029FFD43|nr:GNAT family N-acetyltransferase [Synechococcus sp. PCC 7502]AFY73642.1 acetyltransferase [Synechococcus sp. PCC 7502]